MFGTKTGYFDWPNNMSLYQSPFKSLKEEKAFVIIQQPSVDTVNEFWCSLHEQGTAYNQDSSLVVFLEPIIKVTL